MGKQKKAQEFWSKSKAPEAKHMSNFTKSDRVIEVTWRMLHDCKLDLSTGGGYFDSVEAVYQFCKYLCLKDHEWSKDEKKAKQEKEEWSKKFNTIKDQCMSGGTHAIGLKAKRIGSRKMLKAHGVALDLKKWNWPMQETVMKMAVAARAKVDVKYAEQLEKARAEGWVWLHLEPKRDGSTPEWGVQWSTKSKSYVGNNRLGLIMAQVASDRHRESASFSSAVSIQRSQPLPLALRE